MHIIIFEKIQNWNYSDPIKPYLMLSNSNLPKISHNVYKVQCSLKSNMHRKLIDSCIIFKIIYYGKKNILTFVRFAFRDTYHSRWHVYTVQVRWWCHCKEWRLACLLLVLVLPETLGCSLHMHSLSAFERQNWMCWYCDVA